MIDMKRTISLLLTLCLCSIHGFAYGARGHALVGAIADKRLEQNQTIAQKVSDLLDGMTLEEAANLPDFIKSWDGCSFNKHPSTKAVTDKPRINAELRAFLKANPCTSQRFHRNFHFTDVPVVGTEKYLDGQVGNQFGVGRNTFDIVQLISYCVGVLQGDIPKKNNRAITKAVAIVLLAHYLGDIHQPLHVGAEYFIRKNGKGIPFEPSKTNKGFEDQGGNKLTLLTFNGTTFVITGKNLHNFWDELAIKEAFHGANDAEIAALLAAQEPVNWQLSGDPKTWAQQMADDILPSAREAHDRLSFEKITFVTTKRQVKTGNAKEKNTSNDSYKKWAGGIVKDEIHKGGWRLAALLEETLQ
jgi:hypothetical protein